jgi:hypothetical protein
VAVLQHAAIGALECHDLQLVPSRMRRNYALRWEAYTGLFHDIAVQVPTERRSQRFMSDAKQHMQRMPAQPPSEVCARLPRVGNNYKVITGHKLYP